MVQIIELLRFEQKDALKNNWSTLMPSSGQTVQPINPNWDISRNLQL